MSRSAIALLLVALVAAGCGSDNPDMPTAPTPTPSPSPTPSPAPTPTSGTLTGAVLDVSTGAPVAGAPVTFMDTLGVVRANVGRSATTNSAGLYRFENVTLGNVNLAFTASGYQDRRTGMNLSAEATAVDMELRRLQDPIVITGTIGGPAPWPCTVMTSGGRGETHPCLDFRQSLRRQGTVVATLTWSGGDSMSMAITGAFEQARVSSNTGTLTARGQFFPGGLNYTIRIETLTAGNSVVPFTLSLDVVD